MTSHEVFFQLEPMENPNNKEEHFEFNKDEVLLMMILSIPIDCDVWNCTSIFYTYILFKDKACNLVIDGGDTMKVVFEFAITTYKV